MGTLNSVCLIYSFDDLLVKWHHRILLLAIISFILKKRHTSKQFHILILKTILFIPQNVFQSLHNSFSVAENSCKYSKFKNVIVLIKAKRFT